VETARSIGRILAPTTTPKSSVMVGRVPASNFRTVEVPVAALRSAAKTAGGRLNDAFLAGITAGLHRYHLHHGTSVDELRVAMPISQREATDSAGGNHVTVMRFTVPGELDGRPFPGMFIHSVATHMHYVGTDMQIRLSRNAPVPPCTSAQLDPLQTCMDTHCPGPLSAASVGCAQQNCAAEVEAVCTTGRLVDTLDRAPG